MCVRAPGAVVSDDPRQVVIESVSILVPDRPDLVFPLGTKEAVAALAAQAPVFKEGVLCMRGGLGAGARVASGGYLPQRL